MKAGMTMPHIVTFDPSAHITGQYYPLLIGLMYMVYLPIQEWLIFMGSIWINVM